MAPTAAQLLGLRAGVFLLSLLPLARTVWLGIDGRLGANPIETITRASGNSDSRKRPARRLSSWAAVGTMTQ
jgi:DMSO/TMAO reductase YedYZ heme-binding membrane subunit